MVALFVVLTIVICVAADSIVQWRKSRKEDVARGLTDQLFPTADIENVSAPADVFLDTGHTWVHVAPSGKAEVGLDSFAQKLIGRIDAVVLPEVGKEVHRGDMLFAIRQGDRRAAFASPVNGVVASVDENLAWHPETIQSDPYNEGWVCTLAPKNLAQDLKQLRLAEDARSWLKGEFHRFQEFFAARPLDSTNAGQVARHGGRSTCGALEFADDGTWRRFNDIFLRPDSENRLM